MKSEEYLADFFGGLALITYEPKRNLYLISVENDDLVNEFTYYFPYEYAAVKRLKSLELQKMMSKYIKQMEIEQQLMKKGMLRRARK